MSETSLLDTPLNLESLFEHIQDRLENLHELPTLPSNDALSTGVTSLPESLPETGVGASETANYVESKILPALVLGHSGPRYFGFVIGGTVPAALYGDIMASAYDQNVQVHLPRETISTVVESRALEMILDLLHLPRDSFPLRTITTGATAANILGLANGRDFAVRHALNDPSYSVSEDGFGGAIVKILSDRPHASLVKSASVVGIGRSNMIDLYDPLSKGFDMKRLEEHLASGGPGSKTGFIVSPSYGEVNTGEFTTQMREIRALCDKYHAWIHVDAAFGAFVRVLPELAHLAEGLELADSITGDGHKWLNVPYDSGFFFSRSLSHHQSVFGPSPRAPPPAYLTLAPSSFQPIPDNIPSPLNVNLENSRRFRALPLFCALMSLGRDGYEEMVRRNIAFARRVGEWMGDESEEGGGKWYEVMNATYSAPTSSQSPKANNTRAVVPLNVILFRPRPSSPLYSPGAGSQKMIAAINETRKMYVSPGKDGCARIAVSNWMTGLRKNKDGKDDYEIVIGALRDVMLGAVAADEA